MKEQGNLLQEALRRLSDVELQFAQIGFDPATLDQLRGLLEARDQALTILAKERDRQFWSDASALAAQIRAGNKIAEISAFLRQFAEHVIAQDKLLRGEEMSGAHARVDQICEMTVARERNNEEAER